MIEIFEKYQTNHDEKECFYIFIAINGVTDCALAYVVREATHFIIWLQNCITQFVSLRETKPA